jgi:murein DD-endopeptidase MepM/ murein hydrolase activator NlpD
MDDNKPKQSLNNTAQNLQKIIDNPQNYNLTPEQAQEIANQFSYMVTGNEKFNPDMGNIKGQFPPEVLETQRNRSVGSYLSQLSSSDETIDIPNPYNDLADKINNFSSIAPQNSQALSQGLTDLNTSLQSAQQSFSLSRRTSADQAASMPTPSFSRNLAGNIRKSKPVNSALNKFGGTTGKALVSINNAIANRDTKSILQAGALIGGFLVGGPLGAGLIILLSSRAFRRRLAGVLIFTVSSFITVSLAYLIVLVIFTSLVLVIIRNSAFIVPVSNRGVPAQAGYSGQINAGGGAGPGGAWPSCWPTQGIITQGPVPGHNGYGNSYEAVDVGNVAGTLIYATHDGTVRYKPFGADPNGYGEYVAVYGDGIVTIYAHLQQAVFTQPTQVTAGTLIGYMDNTGNSTGDHLHYEAQYYQNGNLTGPVPIDTIVPSDPNAQGTSVSGCQASESGGGIIPTVCANVGTCSTSCSSTPLQAPQGGWADCSQNQVCCGKSVQPQPGLRCTNAGGQCIKNGSDCPAGCYFSGQPYFECPISAPVCCDVTGTLPTCNGGGAASCTADGGVCSSTNNCTTKQVPSGFDTWDCPNAGYCCEPQNTTPASCSSVGGECRPSDDSSCIPESLPAGYSSWDCPNNGKCCLPGFDVG